MQTCVRKGELAIPPSAPEQDVPPVRRELGIDVELAAVRELTNFASTQIQRLEMCAASPPNTLAPLHIGRRGEYHHARVLGRRSGDEEQKGQNDHDSELNLRYHLFRRYGS